MKRLILASLAFLFFLNSYSQNNPPVAVDDTVEVMSQVPILIDALANDYDPDGDGIFFKSWQSSMGTSLDTASGKLLFRTTEFSGREIVTYSTIDNGTPPKTSKEGKVFIYVNQNPEAPVANADTFDLLQLVPVNLDILINDNDPDGDSLKIKAIYSVEHCKATVSTDSLKAVVIPYLTTFSIEGGFLYRACEKNTSAHLLSDLTSVYINIIPNPDIPEAMPDSASTTGGFVVSIPVMENDFDPQGESIEIRSYTNSENITREGDTLMFTPDISSSGIITFSYRIQEILDSNICSQSAKVKVQVVKNLACPVALPDMANGILIQPLLIEVLTNDYDPLGDEIEIWGIKSNGTVSVSGNKISYKSKPSALDNDTLYYRIRKKFNVEYYSEWTPVYIELADNPDMPDAVDDHVTLNSPGPLIISPLVNDLGNAADTLEIAYIHYSNKGKRIILSPATFSYQPYSNSDEDDTLTYTIWDKNNHDLWAEGKIYIDMFTYHYYDSLDINKINAGVNADGMLFGNLGQIPGKGLSGTFDAHFKYPNGSNTNTIFNSTLWIGGISEDDSLHFSGERYKQAGSDFQPGPVSNAYDSLFAERYWKLWKLNKQEIDFHKNNWWRAGYQPISDIASWPGNGDISSGQAEQLAPFLDNNSDEQYNPMDGDYPLIRGDQCIFFIYNDDLNHTESYGIKLKTEIHGMVYGYNNPADCVLSHTVFVHYDLINRSEHTYHDTYTGIFTDFDLGGPLDDYVGSDVNRASYYCYNGNDFDHSWEAPNHLVEGYGENPPSQSVTVLSGPLMDQDGFDNPSEECDYSVNGTNFGNGIQDDERFGLTRFMRMYYESYYLDPPTNAEDFYTLMLGCFSDGTRLMFGGSGYFEDVRATGPICNFMFPGNSDTINWGTGCAPPNPPFIQDGYFWTDSMTFIPSDRRCVGAMGPFTFAPGDVQEIELAYVVANGWNGPVSSVDKLMEYIDTLRYRVSIGEIIIPNDHLGVNEDRKSENRLNIYPNPAGDFINVDLKGIAGLPEDYVIYDLTGRIAARGKLSMGTLNKINISALKPGFYVITAKSNGYTVSGKFITP